MPDLKISIITVCINAAETIERTIQSVCSQSYPNVEHIIMDGASTDKTFEIIKRYETKIGHFISEKDKGIFDAMNKGLALATGDIIYFLNADDYFYDDRVLRDVAQTFLEDDSRMLVYGKIVLNDPNGLIARAPKAFKTRSIHEFLYSFAFYHQATFARRSMFTEIGGFDCQYRYAADYDWIVKAFNHQSKGFHFLDRAIVHYYAQGRSYQNAALTNHEKLKIQFRHLFSLTFAWYFFRYIFIRRLKKRLLNEKSEFW